MAGRLSIFGGTFDPIHNGHLRAALEAVEELSLDRVLLMPSAQPPHGKRVLSDIKHRLAMCRLAAADDPHLDVSDLEARLGGKSYTVNTLKEIKRINPDMEIYFLIGSDAFFYLHTWHRPMELFALADFVVMARPKSPTTDVLEYMRRNLDPRFAPAQNGWVRLPGGKGAKRVPTTLLSISSTAIRQRVANHKSLLYLVPPAVARYIEDMGLYRDQAEVR